MIHLQPVCLRTLANPNFVTWHFHIGTRATRYALACGNMFSNVRFINESEIDLRRKEKQ